MMQDKLIIGAGLYGLYSALFCGKRGQKVTVLEIDEKPFMRATYINQARVHMGYHYPRSLSTAMKSAGYFKRFVEDYGFSIHSDFAQIYATSDKFSWTSAREFMKFCKDADIPCTPVPTEQYFEDGLCDGAFLTREYTYDAMILRDYFLEELARYPNVQILCSRDITRIVKNGKEFDVYAMHEGKEEHYSAPFVLNATYASVNQILERTEGLGPEAEDFGLKYELCEIILCKPEKPLKDVGITVMDGPFFSIMPFGKTGYHSLTSVTFTPHRTSFDKKPTFGCTAKENCGSPWLHNCNECPGHPESAWPYMSALAHKYLLPEYGFTYERSLFSMKPILKASEIDDSRPTVIKYASADPVFVSVLSGKINTVYDLDSVLL